MTKQEYLKKQQELSEAKWQAYDDGDYIKADAIQDEIEALVDPEPDELLPEDYSLFSEEEEFEIGTWEDVERKHPWMRGTY